VPRWTPQDARQAETYRLLKLLGDAPADFFADCCRLMTGEPELAATTHLVGHLLREIEGYFGGVLEPMADPARLPAPNSPNAHSHRIAAFADALGLAANDPFRALWVEYATGLYRWAHRYSLVAPRPVGHAFTQLWEQGQTVILRLAERIESNFTATLPTIDELAAGEPDVGRLGEHMPHSPVAQDRFFEHASAAWFEPLRDAHYFDNPPRLVENEDGTVSYPRWPPGRFLVRIAAEHPEVLALGVDLDTDNPEAQESFVDAACATSAADAAQLVPTVERWLEMTGAQWALPLKGRELVVHLIAGGEIDTGLRLLRSLLTTPRVGGDRYLAAELLNQSVPEIFPAASIAGLELVADLLAEQVAAESHGRHDYSYIWRPMIAGGRRQDFRDALADAVRDGAAAIVEADAHALDDVVATLDARDWPIFKRVVLDLLLRHTDDELVRERLADHELFDDPNTEREYTALSRERFAALDAGTQEEILAWVEAPPDYLRDEDERRAWQQRQLERFGRPLPGPWEARYLELVGDVPPAEVERVPEIGFVGPRSPLGRDELAAMSVAEIVAAIADWEPDGDEWPAPSPEGLGRVLQSVVVADPERFAAEAIAFTDLDPTYIRALFSGLREAAQNNRTFSWPVVLELAAAIHDRPRRIEGRDERGFELDPGWTWAWQESLHLIGMGLHDGDARIPDEHDALVWSVISHHAEDPNPSLDDERDGDSFGPATRALNSIRGAAMHAVCHYAWWRKGDAPAAERHFSDELTALLDQHLDPEVEPTATVRSVYGQFFTVLAACDEVWAELHADAIFPLADDNRLWRSAWHAYLRFNRAYDNALQLLGAQYRCGVDELERAGDDDTFLGNTGEALIGHLMTFYARGLITFGDDTGLLDRFYEIASVERRTEAIDSIGTGVMNEDALSDAVAGRLRALFERRLAAVADGADGEELRGFAWWFASGKFDDEWSLTQLQALLNAGGRVHPDHVVADRLAALRGDRLVEVVRALELLIERGTRQWFVLGARDEIVAILADALAAGGEAENRSRDIVNRLVARGYRDFDNLLPR
jgi:hypothetical protein